MSLDPPEREPGPLDHLGDLDLLSLLSEQVVGNEQVEAIVQELTLRLLYKTSYVNRTLFAMNEFTREAIELNRHADAPDV